jgi:hypothetical protein
MFRKEGIKDKEKKGWRDRFVDFNKMMKGFGERTKKGA